MTTTSQPRSVAHRAADSLIDSAGTIGALAVGALTAYATYRAAPARWAGHGQLLAAGTTGLAAAIVLDGLAWDALAPLRRRVQPAAAGQEQRILTPLHTLEDALAHLTVDTCEDAAHRAANRALVLDLGNGTLRDHRRWRGYDNGSASCDLTPGLVLHYRPTDHDYGYEYVLFADAEEPVTITSLAQLREHLIARADGAPGDTEAA